MKLLDSVKIGIGVMGSYLISIFGEWNTAIKTLIIFMAIDWVTGMAVAMFWKSSPKSKTGALSSQVGFKGLMRKCAILAMVVVGNMLDKATGTDFVRNAVVIAYVTNETVSIIENVGIMGVPIPTVIKNLIDTLKEKL